MLSRMQRAVLKAYDKAQLSLKSYAVVYDDGDYMSFACDDLDRKNRQRTKNYDVVAWLHPHIRPCWESEYDISEDDYSEYREGRQ